MTGLTLDHDRKAPRRLIDGRTRCPSKLKRTTKLGTCTCASATNCGRAAKARSSYSIELTASDEAHIAAPVQPFWSWAALVAKRFRCDRCPFHFRTLPTILPQRSALASTGIHSYLRSPLVPPRQASRYAAPDRNSRLSVSSLYSPGERQVPANRCQSPNRRKQIPTPELDDPAPLRTVQTPVRTLRKTTKAQQPGR